MPTVRPVVVCGVAAMCFVVACQSLVGIEDSPPLSVGGGNSGGGGSGGSGGSGDCSSEVLVAGAVPPTQYACGDSITDGASLTVKNAKNDRRYAVGVAAVDNLGNPGVLSPLECVAPLPVDDFFKVYNRAHGEGGCIGGCSSSGQQSAGLAAGVLLLGIVIVRRRRTSTSRSKCASLPTGPTSTKSRR